MTLLLLAVACTDINQDDLLLPRDTDTDTAAPDTDDTGDTGGPALPTGPDRLLLLNGKLSSAEANYTLNARDEDGDWLGSNLYVYDPAEPGALRHLGWLWFGPDDGLHDWETMIAREVAVAPDGTVWAVLIDQGAEDEWLLARVDVPDLTGVDQELVVTPWAIHPDDAAYEAADLTGAGFDADGSLHLGTPADGAFPGYRYTLGPFPPAADADPYYAAAGLVTNTGEFTGNLGVAGDIALHDGALYALVRSGADFGTNALYDLGAGTIVGEGIERDADAPFTALATLNGALVAVGTDGDVWSVDPATGAFTRVDDVAAALPEDDRGQSTRRLRGGATLRLP